MVTGTIQRTIALLQSALCGLEADVPILTIERLGVMINRAMTSQGRSFHTPDHIFSLSDERVPHTTLAALFHDVVYYQVDSGFDPEIADLLQPYVREEAGTIVVADGGRRHGFPLSLSLTVFGFDPGQVLSPFGGMNEYLSALTMNLCLESMVSRKALLATTACIEATIPFRGKDDSGLSPAERLARRVADCSEQFELRMNGADVDEVVKWSVLFANKDVENFSEEDVARFLDNTWKLLPETNPSLRNQGIYTIGSYRTALQKMDGFMRALDPAHVYCSYAGVPDKTDYERLVALAGRNVLIGRSYLGIKLLTAAVLEALAVLTGGDAPISLFMGDIGSRGPGSRIEDHLPEIAPSAEKPMQKDLRDLLAYGRASESSFDLQNSPLSLFVYQHIGDDGLSAYLDAAREMVDGTLNAEEFLRRLPAAMIASIAAACAEIAFTRSDALRSFAATVRADHP